MNTVTLVCLAIWNLLLFVTFALVVIFRKELTRWLTDIDGFSREADAEWIAFLADHPELRALVYADAARSASPLRE